jgi:cystathionine beta-lyase/cystathionine gamma-synthase
VDSIKDETLVNHQPQEFLPEGNKAVVAPIYHSVKFTAETCKEFRELFTKNDGHYVYSRVSNPTVRQVELLLAKIQGREEAIAVGSGVAALSASFLSLLKPGDHVLMFLESYKPTRYLLRNLMGKFGVESSMVSLVDKSNWERELKPGKTKLIVFESPTNPMTRIADIEALTRAAKDCGALTLMDNTFAGFHNHGQYPVDIFVHSLTKFAGGHGDAMGGIIIGNSEVIKKIRFDVIEIGPVLDPYAAYLFLRGMKTYFLRYKKCSDNCLEVAKFLETHPSVEKVYYPGLPSHPEYALAKKQLRDFGGILSFKLRGGNTELERFVDRLKLFVLTGSLGSTESLVAPTKSFYAGDFDEKQLRIVDIHDSTVRLSVGIEAVEDLIHDLQQAL